jgi:hypothetical protein
VNCTCNGCRQNKANSRRCRAARGPEGRGPQGRLCKTNPVSAAGGRSRARTPNPRREACAPKQSQFGSARPVPGGTDCAKQTQFVPAGEGRWGKPHPTGGLDCAKQTQFGPGQTFVGGEICETNPICGPRTARTPKGQNVQNEPNFGESGGSPGAAMRNKANGSGANRHGGYAGGLLPGRPTTIIAAGPIYIGLRRIPLVMRYDGVIW